MKELVEAFERDIKKSKERLKSAGCSDGAAAALIVRAAIDAFPEKRDSVLESIGHALLAMKDDANLKEHGITVNEELYHRKRRDRG